jgi:uncharacterized protein YehS (DUF1456 family)
MNQFKAFTMRQAINIRKIRFIHEIKNKYNVNIIDNNTINVFNEKINDILKIENDGSWTTNTKPFSDEIKDTNIQTFSHEEIMNKYCENIDTRKIIDDLHGLLNINNVEIHLRATPTIKTDKIIYNYVDGYWNIINNKGVTQHKINHFDLLTNNKYYE